jgi:3-hydroxyisobutyrate dehydrogenase-like beta-hydroxyacid dehydrogenase
MTVETVAVVSAGDMGHAVGAVLAGCGLEVITALDGRSQRTRELAAKAGMVDVGDADTLVARAEILLSIIPPDQAIGFAERISAAVKSAGADLVFVDCNAISPDTTGKLGAIVTASGARFVDAGIVGGPPKIGGKGPRFYASGEHAGEFAVLADHGLDVRVIGDAIGEASALKMCYAAITKGAALLGVGALVTAEAMGVGGLLLAELRSSQAAMLDWLEGRSPGMPPKAYRWVGEMEEIAATYKAAGLTPDFHLGAAAMCRFVEASPLGKEVPEKRTMGTTLEGVIEHLAAFASGREAGQGRAAGKGT